MEKSFDELLVSEFGFDSREDFNNLVTSFHIDTPQKMTMYKNWQHNDGTKAGLLRLISLLPT